jgi:hypothetical protein
MSGATHKPYSVIHGAEVALDSLILSVAGQIPHAIIDHAQTASFSSSSPSGAALHFPCPLKEQEATAAIKALEAGAVAAIADLRSADEPKPRQIDVDLDKVACFLMSAYITTLDGIGKGDVRIKTRIPGRWFMSSCRKTSLIGSFRAYVVLPY